MKYVVLIGLLQIYGFFFSFYRYRCCGAFCCTFLTAGAFGVIQSDAVHPQGQCLLRTDRDAMMAMAALLAVPKELDAWSLAFRVGAPAAAQRAALEKNRGTDTGTIVDAEFLNIK